MTDNEIIKGLECHSKPSNSCGSSCPYLMCEEILCTKKLTKDALDLINRQQAENDKLKYQVNRLKKYDERRDFDAPESTEDNNFLYNRFMKTE